MHFSEAYYYDFKTKFYVYVVFKYVSALGIIELCVTKEFTNIRNLYNWNGTNDTLQNTFFTEIITAVPVFYWNIPMKAVLGKY